MKAFVSWSGGKDCMLALYRFNKEKENTIVSLVNMSNAEGTHSRSHGIKNKLVKEQAKSLNIPLIQKATGRGDYEQNFKSVISKLKEEENITTGVFGDIYLEAHRVWIDRVCSEMGIDAVFPLWEESTEELLKEFISEGFETVVVAINNTKLSKDWLGRKIDNQFLADIIKLDGIDPCAENGEYHSFVYNGPIFNSPLDIKLGNTYSEEKNTFIETSLF